MSDNENGEENIAEDDVSETPKDGGDDSEVSTEEADSDAAAENGETDDAEQTEADEAEESTDARDHSEAGAATHQPEPPDPSITPNENGIEALIEGINFRFQRLYGNVSLVVLAVWLALFISAWITIDQGWTVAIIGIGSALLGLFALRAAVHMRSTPLLAEVEDFRTQHHLSLDELISTARTMTPPADFFVSLVDGPMARQRRQRQTQTTDDE